MARSSNSVGRSTTPPRPSAPKSGRPPWTPGSPGCRALLPGHNHPLHVCFEIGAAHQPPRACAFRSGRPPVPAMSAGPTDGGAERGEHKPERLAGSRFGAIPFRWNAWAGGRLGSRARRDPDFDSLGCSAHEVLVQSCPPCLMTAPHLPPTDSLIVIFSLPGDEGPERLQPPPLSRPEATARTRLTRTPVPRTSVPAVPPTSNSTKYETTSYCVGSSPGTTTTIAMRGCACSRRKRCLTAVQNGL